MEQSTEQWNGPRHLSDMSNGDVGKTTRVALEVTVVRLVLKVAPETNGSIGEERVFPMSGLKEVEVVIYGKGVEVVFQRGDVRMVENLLGMGERERKRRPLPRDTMRSWQRHYDDGGD